MPLYQYSCSDCQQEFKILHGIDEQNIVCKYCNSQNINKCLPKLSLSVNTSKQTSAGERVEKFIEESREALKEQLVEARKDLKI